MNHKRALTLLGALTLALAQSAAAQTFPAKSIRFINPYPPGGGTDTFARILAQRMTETLGQQVYVDNRGGAQGSVGTAVAAKAPPMATPSCSRTPDRSRSTRISTRTWAMTP